MVIYDQFRILAVTKRVQEKPPSDYDRTCFVIMAYGRRKIRNEEIDFDAIYDQIIKPAISNCRVNGNFRLRPRRADRMPENPMVFDAMYRDLLLSRLALAEISVNSPNVYAEVFARYSLIRSGTVLFRLPGVPVPFDLSAVLVREYRYTPLDEAKKARRLISAALRHTIRYSYTDSPVFAFASEAVQRVVHKMGPLDNPTPFGVALINAEKAAWNGDFTDAASAMKDAIKLEPSIEFPHLRRGELLLHSGSPIEEARDELLAAARMNPNLLSNSIYLPFLDKGVKPPFSWTSPRRSIEDLLDKYREKLMQKQLHNGESRLMRLNTVDIRLDPFFRGDGRLITEVSVRVDPQGKSLEKIPDILTRYGSVVDMGTLELADMPAAFRQFDVTSPASLCNDRTPMKMARHLKSASGSTHYNVHLGSLD